MTPSEQYLRPYREAVQRFGPSFSATLWMSREAQQLRFDVMIGLGRLEQAVILDAGCGTGDFAEHLHQREVPFSRYIGVDAVDELIHAARARHLPRCEFLVGDLLHDHALFAQIEPDIVCISGTLNTMDEAAARDLVSDAFDAARQSVVFNFLSDRAAAHWMGREIGPSRRFNTLNWIDWALSRTSLVAFAHDYLQGHDATIVMRKT